MICRMKYGGECGILANADCGVRNWEYISNPIGESRIISCIKYRISNSIFIPQSAFCIPHSPFHIKKAFHE